ncbi:MAG: PIN domain-containing protein [Promicromonosporaceae bacterium]|nr:PIN domain-containing protein [Promicromonosporaceae bacterium]
MPTADTNIILRWMLDDVPELTDAADRVLTQSQRCVVPNVAIIEAVYVLERVMRLPRATIVQLVEALLAEANIDAEREIWKVALADYESHPKLSAADTFLAAAADRAGRVPLYTFDQKLAKQNRVAQLPQ